jgi:hypothetical protein
MEHAGPRTSVPNFHSKNEEVMDRTHFEKHVQDFWPQRKVTFLSLDKPIC